MASRNILRQGRVLPIAAALLTPVILLRPRDAYAEASNTGNDSNRLRKPIYDDPIPRTSRGAGSEKSLSQRSPPNQIPPVDSDSSLEASSELPSYTDELAKQIGAARLHVYSYFVRAEDSFNSFMSRAFSLENDFTDTIASLAPPKSANEPLFPGFAYIMVATLAGSIVTRNRGIVLRTFIPGVFGIVTAYAVVPTTMRNLEGLVSKYEERYPRLLQSHEQARDRLERFWETGKSHAGMTVEMGQVALDDARKKMEEWVRKGK